MVNHVEHLLFSGGDTLLATLDKNFIGLQVLAGTTAFALLIVVFVAAATTATRECNLDTILFLQPNDVLPTRTDQSRMKLVGDTKDL